MGRSVKANLNASVKVEILSDNCISKGYLIG